jgi:hypothetical protein
MLRDDLRSICGENIWLNWDFKAADVHITYRVSREMREANKNKNVTFKLDIYSIHILYNVGAKIEKTSQVATIFESSTLCLPLGSLADNFHDISLSVNSLEGGDNTGPYP